MNTNWIPRRLNCCLILCPVVLVGCAANQPIAEDYKETQPVEFVQQSITQSQTKLVSNETENQRSGSDGIFSELLILMYSDFGAAKTSSDTKNQAPGPELVAGDWLAWECAMVMEYWDIPMNGFSRQMIE